MDINEALLFKHISIVIKLLNNFSDKNNIITLHVLHRLDYLYERLSDFLGRELNNEWWQDNKQTESQLTLSKSSQHLIFQSAAKLAARVEPVYFQPSQYVENAKSSRLIPFNCESPQNTGTSDSSIESLCSESSQNDEISRDTSTNAELGAADFDEQKNESSSVNCEVPQDVGVAAEPENLEHSGTTESYENVIPVLPIDSAECSEVKSAVNSYKCEVCKEEIQVTLFDYDLSLSLHVESTVHQEAMKLKNEQSAVDINAKEYVREKKRTNLGNHIIEKITASYLCNVCNVNISDSVRSHVSENGHWDNMKAKRDIDVAGTENTESICEKIVITYRCQLCSVDIPCEKNVQGHITGHKHVEKMLEGISDPNIKTNEKGLYRCNLCYVEMNCQYNVTDHLHGKLHRNGLEQAEKRKSVLSDSEKQKYEDMEGISDQYIINNEKKNYYRCVLCFANLSGQSSVTAHLQGKLHKKNLKKQSEENVSLQSICKKQKYEDVEAQFINFSDIAMVCKMCNIYVLKVHLKEHVTSKKHVKAIDKDYMLQLLHSTT